MKITENTWISSDHHFGHKNITEFEPRRLDTPYGQNWEGYVIKQHNSVVGEHDSVLFLGDFSFLDPLKYSQRLNGRKSLILGNHDRKGLQPYKDFVHVQRGISVDWNGKELKYVSDDALLSGIIQDIGGVVCGFCHYTPGYSDEYDDQRSSGIMIKHRKKVLDEFFDSMGVEVVFHGHLHSKLAIGNKYKYINCCLEHHNLIPVKVGELLEKYY